MYQLFVRQSLATAFLFAALTPQLCHATGDYTSPRWLDQGGIASEHSPEFYWADQMRELAQQYHVKERRLRPDTKATNLNTQTPENDSPKSAGRARQLEDSDLADFEDAIKSNRFKPSSDADKAMAQHKAARDAIAAANETTTAALPAEEPSEFADYHKGAFAFHRGQAHYVEAKAAWEALLRRPKNQRHYRSVWAAFMLGKLALYARQPEAIQWFHKTRQLAQDGFADSLGLAADSYGWEAKSELEQGHLEKAAALYLNQLSLDDPSALVSLKAIVPDRPGIDGMMNFAPLPPENADEATLKKFAAEEAKREASGLERAARDPLLRRITTAHVLATETARDFWLYAELYPDTTTNADPSQPKPGQRCRRWLEAIEKAKISKVENAASLGWVAYTAGNYEEAERWSKLDQAHNTTALWLKAKLQRRAGKLDDAAKLMAEAIQSLITASWATMADDNEGFYSTYTSGFAFAESARGELGALHLSRGDFVDAFDAFYTAGLNDDASFMAEHVLTADELKTYTDTHVPWTEADAAKAEATDTRPSARALHWLLGRRLVREDRYADARPYLPAKYREVLDRYTAALTKGADEKLSKQDRARAFFDAAVIARYDGMEIMGTEAEPDGANSGGSFEPTDVAGQRETGATYTIEYKNDKEVRVAKPLKLHVPVTAEEKKRLAQFKPAPNKRFHYRYIAAALGWKAAQLLPDNSEELADVLNTSGGWIKKDDTAADKFFLALKKRAPKTTLAKEALPKRWFIEHYGPWSTAPKEQ